MWSPPYFLLTEPIRALVFAIPAYSAVDIARNLILKGKIERGYLGIEMHKLTPMEADFFGLGETNGMLITGVHADSPAQVAGIELGDVLLSIDSTELLSIEQGPGGRCCCQSRNKDELNVVQKR